jgi:cytoskeletal protein RodZ
VAANTKIGLPLLQALERGDVSRWPGGIFRRSFVRDYASAIGLDPTATVAEFLERFPDPDAASTPAIPPPPSRFFASLVGRAFSGHRRA